MFWWFGIDICDWDNFFIHINLHVLLKCFLTVILTSDPHHRLDHRFPKLETVVYAPAPNFENKRQLHPHVYSHGGVTPFGNQYTTTKIIYFDYNG